ncbi:MAG: hypothetical protein OXU67_08090 [Chloroflexota bacterium]|nr:hypothetical protein [Chloroflexota bacterium]
MEILRVAYEIAVIVLALMALIGSLIVAVIFGGLAFVVHRWGNKAVDGAHIVRVKAAAAEDAAHRGVQRGVIRPVAQAQGWAQWLSTFGRRALDDS